VLALLVPTILPGAAAGQPNKEPLVPKRTIEFATSDDPLAVPLFEADPKLLEQRYAAELRVTVVDYGDLYNALQDSPPELREKLAAAYRSLAQSGRGGELATRIQALWPANPEGPASADSQYVSSSARAAGEGGRSNAVNVTYRVLGATPEQVQQRTRAFVDVLDRGIIEPIQQQLLAIKTKHETELAESRKSDTEARREIAELSRQLKDAEVLDVQVINDLRTQRRLLEVDLAGVKARVQACAEILKRELPESRREQVENLKLTAEIELAGLDARQQRIETIIDQSQKALALNSRLNSARAASANAWSSAERSEKNVARYAQTIRTYGPLRLLDETIVIRPVQWQKPAP
jgi:hypothetical protein